MTTQTQQVTRSSFSSFPTIPQEGSSSSSFFKRVPKNDGPPPPPLSPSSLKQISNPLTSSELDAFVKDVFKKAFQTEGPSTPSGGPLSTEDVISDISWLIRTFMAEAPATEFMGLTTGENIAQGFIAAIKAATRYAQAKDLKDHPGMIEGGIDFFRGVLQTEGGLAFLINRITMAIADIRHVNTSMTAPTPLGQTANISGAVGSVAFLLLFFAFGAWGSYGLYIDFEFSDAMKEFNDPEHPENLFDYLVQKVIADPNKKVQKLNDAAYRNKLSKIALSKLTSCFLKWQDELIKAGKLTDPMTKQQVKEMFKKSLGEQKLHDNATLGLDPKNLDQFHLTTLEWIGFTLEAIRSQAKKEKKFSRVTSSECTDAVKSAFKRGLGPRQECNDPLVKHAARKEWEELKGKIVFENTKNKIIHTALVVISVIGIIASVIGIVSLFVALPPAALIALTVLTVLLCVGMLGVDGYFMAEGLKNGPPNPNDKKYVVVVSLIILAALIASIGVTLGLGLALLPMYLAIAIGVPSLGVGGMAFYKLNQKEKAWIKEHPDLQRFETLLDSKTQDAELDQEVSALFKKLSKEDRFAIRKKYKELSLKGACLFRQPDYQKLDESHKFGSEFLKKTLKDNEYQSIVRAMKKTVKFYWEKWAQTKNEDDRQVALHLQAIFERMKLKENLGFLLYTELMEADELTQKKLTENIWYVVKRQESLADLKRVVEAVLQDKNPADQSAEENNKKVLV